LKLQNQGKVTVGQAIEPNDTTAFEQLKVQNSQGGPKTFAILTIHDPGISASSYALTGKVRYEEVDGVGYLEIWSYLDDGGRYFSRTLGDSGPMQSLRGSSDWRPFSVPFYIADTTEARPFKLELNVVLPGRGTVYLSPLELVQYGKEEKPVSPVGSVFGILGGVLGGLAGFGKAHRVAFTLLLTMFVSGVASLALGLVAILQSQPYPVFYPLLLGGTLVTVLLALLYRPLRKRYEGIELRKMKSMDLS
jgi:hypothetical protein